MTRKIKKTAKKIAVGKRPQVPLIGVAGQRAAIGIGGSRYKVRRQPDVFTIGKLPTKPKVVRR